MTKQTNTLIVYVTVGQLSESSECKAKPRRQCCQMCYFFIWSFGGWRIFWLFRIILAEYLADFCTRFRPVFGSQKCKNPFNVVYCRQMHCFWICKVVCTSAGCFNPMETLCLVKLPCPARPVTGWCSRRVLDCIESTYPENRRCEKS